MDGEATGKRNSQNEIVSLDVKGELLCSKRKMSLEKFVDVGEMKQITLGDKKLSDELLDMYLADLKQNIPIMEDLYEKGDFKACQALAHYLRGASCQLGFTKLNEVCRKIEDDPSQDAIKSLKKSYLYLIKKEKDICDKINNK